MKIKCLSSDGPHHREVKGLKLLEVTNNSNFAYSNLCLIHGNLLPEYDLIIILNNLVLVVELKDYNGIIDCSANTWIHNTRQEEDQYKKIAKKKFILFKQFETYLKNQTDIGDNIPWVQHCLVFTGKLKYTENFKRYITVENKFIYDISTFCKILDKNNSDTIRDIFDARKLDYNLHDYKNKFDQFFGGKRYFLAKDFLYDDKYKADKDPIYLHPDEFYSEYFAENPTYTFEKALIRKWDFHAFPIELQGKDNKNLILNREKEAYEYVNGLTTHFRNGHILLRPNTGNSISEDYEPYEIFSLDQYMEPVNEYVYKNKLNFNDKTNLINILLDTFERLHEIEFYHRDLSIHKVWIDDNLNLKITGLHTSSFPTDKTVSAFRDKLLSSNINIPDNVYNITTTHSKIDVYYLTYIIYVIIFEKLPPIEKDSDCPHWVLDDNNIIAERYNSFFSQGLSDDPNTRPNSAKELKIIFNKINTNTKINVSDDKLKRYRKKFLIKKKYSNIQQIKKVDNYELIFNVDSKSYIKTLELNSIKDDEHIYITNLFNKIDTLNSSASFASPELLDYGIDNNENIFFEYKHANGILIKEFLNSKSINLNRFISSMIKILQISRELANKGVIHNDLKDEHIFIDTDKYSVQLIDWFDLQYFKFNHGNNYSLELDKKNLDLTTKSAMLWARYICNLLTTISNLHKNKEVFLNAIQRINSEIVNDYKPFSYDILISIIKTCMNQEGVLLVNTDPTYDVYIEPISENRYVINVEEFNSSVNSNNNKRISVIGLNYKLVFFVNSDGTKFLSKINQYKLKDNELNRYLAKINDNEFKTFLKSKAIQLQKGSNDERFRGAIQSYIKKVSENNDIPLTTNKSKRSINDEWNFSIEKEKCESEKEFLLSKLDCELFGSDNIEFKNLHEAFRLMDCEPNDILISIKSTKTKYELKGSVINLDPNKGRLFASFSDHHKIFNSNTNLTSYALKIVNRISHSSFKKQKRSVDGILQGISCIPKLSDIMNGSFPEYNNVKFNDDLSGYNLNVAQLEAVKTSLNNFPISIVQGPPGTGKTYFIGSLIHYALTKNKVKNILLVSQTHIAIDNALNKARAIYENNHDNLSAIRLGSETNINPYTRCFHSKSLGESRLNVYRSRINSDIHKILHSKFNIDENYIIQLINLCEDFIGLSPNSEFKYSEGDINYLSQKYSISELSDPKKYFDNQLKLLRNHFDLRNIKIQNICIEIIKLTLEYRISLINENIFERFMVKTKNLVCGTCVGIDTKKSDVESTLFDLVIIDEASRATSGQLAIPIQRAKKIILVGDHKQLPPQIDLKELGFTKKSDFEFLATHNDLRSKVFLNEQYRMCKEISDMVSFIFYNNKLLTKRDESNDYSDINNSIFKHRLNWVNPTDEYYTSETKKRYGSNSTSNLGEARAIIQFLKLLNNCTEFLESSLSDKHNLIGIISFYSAQVDLINDLLIQETWNFDYNKLIKVGTVDSYQGEENKIIILSLTKSNTRKDTGFTKSDERINVSISRAMDYLFIFGSTLFWEQCDITHPVKKVLTYISNLSSDKIIDTYKIL
jgi:hypothetical protein